MVLIAPLIGAATLFSSLVVALPRPGGSDMASYGSSGYQGSQDSGSYDQSKGQDYGSDQGYDNSKDNSDKGSNYDNGDKGSGYDNGDKGSGYDNGDKGSGYDNGDKGNYGGDNKGDEGKDNNSYGGDYGGDKGDDKSTDYNNGGYTSEYNDNNQYTTSEYNNNQYTTSEYNNDNQYTTSEYNQYTETSTAEYESTTEYNNQYTETSSAEYESTTEYQNTEYQNTQTEEETSTQEYTQTENTQTAEETSTSTAENSYSTPSYGSGSSSYGGSGYDDCVQQCMASFAPSAGSYQPTATSGSEGSEGTGATITVIVAPTQGVLRFVPFAVNASVGDTIKFMWGANGHTVTKGSALLPCNKSADAETFASGLKDKDFVYTQVVNSTDPTYFYCAAPMHCQKGMFGVVNGPSNFNAPTSASGMMSDLTSKNPDLKAYAAYTSNMTAGSKGEKWGGNMDLSAMPDWAHEAAVENILFTRNMLAANPELLQENGLIDLSNLNTTPLMVPPDTGAVLANAAGSSAPASPAPTSGSGASEAAASSAPAYNGATSMASPKAVVAVMAAVASLFLMM